MPDKRRHTFVVKPTSGLIEIPKVILELLPLGESVSVTLEYEEEACNLNRADQSHLDALDDVHDSYP